METYWDVVLDIHLRVIHVCMVGTLILDYHTLSEVPPGRPFGPFGSVLSMSVEQKIVSKWSFRLVGNTHLDFSTDCKSGLACSTAG